MGRCSDSDHRRVERLRERQSRPQLLAFGLHAQLAGKKEGGREGGREGRRVVFENSHVSLHTSTKLQQRDNEEEQVRKKMLLKEKVKEAFLGGRGRSG